MRRARRLALFAVVGLAAGHAFAQADPLNGAAPIARPDMNPAAEEPGVPDGALPPARPDDLEGEPADGDAEDLVAHDPVVEEVPTCRARLAELDVTFTNLAPISGAGGCGLPRPLKVSEIAGIRLQAPATLNCATAEALAVLLTEHAVPAARNRLEAEPNAIAIGSSYVCRTRNSRPGAKLSEHAIGNGVDIMSFGFPRRDSVAVAAFDASAPEAAFLADVRAAACDLFTTVLGPGSDPAHANHFHLDLRKRRNDYRICQ